MSEAPLDPGLSQKYERRIQRVINADGSFNVRRIGMRLMDRNLFHVLINLTWTRFLAVLLLGYILLNGLFAGIYLLIGMTHLVGAATSSTFQSILSALFFSAHTFTTVGYGNIAPQGFAANLTSAAEATLGMLSFALATSLLYGRFSRPQHSISFSKNAVITPYQEISGLMFRLVNVRDNQLLELEASVILMTVENKDGQFKRVYRNLDLERNHVQFMPLTWTIVHPINDTSPLFNKTAVDLEALQAEILITIKAFDDTFSQFVHAQNSYRADEILWGVHFVPAFHIDDAGELIVDVRKVHAVER
jgi:inward rectifier potassium channel